MPAKIKVEFNLDKSLDAARKDFNQRVASNFADEIKDEISKGKSPVKGVARFAGYSEAYKKQITKSGGRIRGTDGRLATGKAKRPVNLFVSGTMLGSLRTRISNRAVKVWFNSKFAAYHNEGQGNLPRRPLLPTESGEQFSRTLTNSLYKMVQKSLDMKLK